jgi:hypothetical protein
MEGIKIDNSHNSADVDILVEKIGQLKANEETEPPGKVEANQNHNDVYKFSLWLPSHHSQSTVCNMTY